VTEGHEVRGPKADVSGGGVLVEGAVSPSLPARGSGERCKLPQAGSGAEPRPPSDFTTSEVLRKASFLIAQEA